MSEITLGVGAIIVDKLGAEESKIASETSFTSDLEADSFDTIELIVESEEEFSISIPDGRAEKTGAVDDAASYIEEHVK